MALFSAKGPNIPKDHIPLTRREAVTFQLELISTLAPPKYSYFVKYGPQITSTLGIASSTFLTTYYRKSVSIGNINRVYTALPLIIAPAFAHMGLHKRFVRDDIIIQKWACPYCYHMRSSLFQVFFGVMLPIVTSSVAAFAIARRLRQPGVPALNNFPEIYKFFLEKTRPLSRPLTLITFFQFLIGVGVAQAEAMQNNYFNQNIEYFIRQYENNNRKELESEIEKEYF